MEFKEWPKIARLNRRCVITEKIDGTNAAIHIEEVGCCFAGHGQVDGFDAINIEFDNKRYRIATQSRTRFITPENDNHGFARWVFGNAESLVQLGPGIHFGEWWGSGIQRAYGLKNGDKRFSLFNTGRWTEDPDMIDDKVTLIPSVPGLSVVPVIFDAPFSSENVEHALEALRKYGSFAVPGFMRPEGIVIYHTALGGYFKVTLENDAEPKGLTRSR